MSSKIGLKLTRKYSINFSLPKRPKKNIKFLIIHYTGMKKESLAIKKLCNPKSKVSAHYYIKKNGEILQMVPDLYEAWHAGKSKWKNFNSLNKFSIGIEITNKGHQYGYKKFSKNQITSLKRLIKNLITKYNISFNSILGHSDISPDRKKDPGEKFPWEELAINNSFKWPKLDKKKIANFRGTKLSSKKEEYKFLRNLYKFGYNKIYQNNSNLNIKLLTKAFQRRFRQDLIDGRIDRECLLISNYINKS